jgi:hypothetical protein
MNLKTIQFLAVTLTALALKPSGAHSLALPNKIGLQQDAYYVAQGSYHGWALLGAALIGALLANFGPCGSRRPRISDCSGREHW